MSVENEHIHVEFHRKARDIFFALLKDFESSSKKLNRRKQEYRFQELKNKYVNTLKQGLESCAMLLLSDHQKSKKLKELNQSLRYFIKEYMHRFVQTTRSI